MKVSKGRPFGPRSKRWSMIASDWAEFWRLDCIDFLECCPQEEYKAVVNSCPESDRQRLIDAIGREHKQ